MNSIDVSSPCVTMVNPPHLLNHLGGLWARHRRGGYVSSYEAGPHRESDHREHLYCQRRAPFSLPHSWIDTHSALDS
jgi:hypothetical protein